MLVLGIDPGIAICGIALVAYDKNKLLLIHSQAITTFDKQTTAMRLLTIYQQILRLIKKFKPDTAALENLFFNTNAKTALTVGQARGVVQLALSQHNLKINEYTPLQVKMALTGYGRAEKMQIAKMVAQILKLPKILTPDDVADAAAIALTHCFSYKLNQKIDL